MIGIGEISELFKAAGYSTREVGPKAVEIHEVCGLVMTISIPDKFRSSSAIQALQQVCAEPEYDLDAIEDAISGALSAMKTCRRLRK